MSSGLRPDSRSLAFAVQARHLRVVVPLAGDGSRRDGGLDPGDLIGVQLELERAERLREPVTSPGSDERDDVLSP